MFDVDTGSDHTIVSTKDWRKLGSPMIRPSSLKLECYSGEALEIQGECVVQVEYHERNFNLTMVIVKLAGSPILGLRWISEMQIDLNSLIYGTDVSSHRVKKSV